MAKLNPNLILSMVSDLNDLHNIGREMMCIDSNCEIVSWKYPDKLMKDIEIDTDTLIETWDKYVLLLELIIDRLYQVMCLSTIIMDTLPQLSNAFKLPKNTQRASSISLGSVVSFFWKRLQVLMIPENLLSRTSINTKKTSEETINIANCESCHLAIKMVKQLISTLENCMKENSLHSKITEQRTNLKKEIFELSQSEAMEQWINAIDIDLKKLTTFCKKNSLRIQDYKKELDLMKESNDKNVEILRSTQTKYANLEKQYIDDKNKIRDLTNANSALELKYNEITGALKLSKESCKNAEEKFQNILNQTMTDNKTTITNLKSEYFKQITRISNEKDQWIEISGKSKQQINELETQLKLQWEKQTEAERKLRQDFDKEKQKVTEEKLKVEKENEKLLKKIQELEEQMKDNSTIFALKEELYKAKQEIKQHKEREIFLVRYPDLNGSIEQNHINQCKMDPFQDMEQQLVANEIRIQLLQEQNVSLRRTVNKMKAISSSTNGDYSRK